PDAADIAAWRVLAAEQQTARHHVLDHVRARRRGLEGEVVERALVTVVRAARQAVVEQEIGRRLVAPEPRGGARLVLRGAHEAEPDPGVVDRVVAREDLVEAAAEGETVEARGR